MGIPEMIREVRGVSIFESIRISEPSFFAMRSHSETAMGHFDESHNRDMRSHAAEFGASFRYIVGQNARHHRMRSNISLHPTVLSPLRAAKPAAELHR